MKTASSKKSLVQMTHQISNRGARHARDRMNVSRMTDMLYRVCMVIYQIPGISQDGIAQCLQVDKSSIAKIASRAVETGLINREINPEDRRGYLLNLTEKGEEITVAYIDELSKWEKKVMTVLSADERKQLKDLLARIEEKAIELD